MFGKAQDLAGRTKLLIVDDDEKFARLLRDYLEPFGYQIDTAHDGRQGLAMALRGTPKKSRTFFSIQRSGPRNLAHIHKRLPYHVTEYNSGLVAGVRGEVHVFIARSHS